MTTQEEREQASAIDVEARTKALADAGIIGNGSQAPAGRKRATRRDAGTKRVPKVQPDGRLTVEQVAHIEKLRIEMQGKSTEARMAEIEAITAERAYHAYLSEITAK